MRCFARSVSSRAPSCRSPWDVHVLHPDAALTSETPAPVRQVVVFRGAQGLPADFGRRVELLGGTLEASLDSIGVAIVAGLPADSAASLAAMSDVAFVESDTTSSLVSDEETLAAADAGDGDNGASVATTDLTATRLPSEAKLFARQWNMRAIGADRAWAAGFLGSKTVTVAIMDTGIDYLNPELVGLVDLSRSRSFVPNEDALVQAMYPGRNPVTDLFYHGTGVSATIVTNGVQLAGVTRNLTLVAVKVADRNGAFATCTVLQGACVCCGSGCGHRQLSGARRLHRHANAGMLAAFERAYEYGWRKGMLVVSVSGNNSRDWQHDDGDVSTCELDHSMCLAATGPTSDAPLNGPLENVDAIATYSGFGRGTVDVAEPGGSRLKNTRIWLPCPTTPSSSSPISCRPKTMGNGTCASPAAGTCLFEGIGTSWSAPHTAGLAALLIEQIGHDKPSQIRAAILQSADDLGAPGVDPFYGHGRINVPRALGLTN